MLKETALSITPIVTHLFNISITLGELPDECETARVSPIPKSGDHSDPRNHWPISLLSLLSKVLEKHIQHLLATLEKHIQHLLATHLEENHSISAQQWGFTHGKSTTGALLDVTDHWHKELELSHDICSVFFDYSKAFNSVPHLPLLHKLQPYGAHPQILRWLANYITMKKQYVCVSGATSDTLPVSSGVPQGSVLAPMLFNIYINDITAVALSDGSMTLFADDMMLYRPIHTAADFKLILTSYVIGLTIIFWNSTLGSASIWSSRGGRYGQLYLVRH